MDSADLSQQNFARTPGGEVTTAGGNASASAYPLFRAAGSPRELGRQHGEQASDRIRAHVEVIAAESHLSLERVHAQALVFQPLLEKYCPHLLEEMCGLAEGAGIPLAAALAVNIRGEIVRAEQAGCTTYAVGTSATMNRQILAGQNSDMGPHVPPLGYVLHLKPVNKPEVLMWTFGGMIGYHGINNRGVGHFANSLFGHGPAVGWGLPHYPLKRLMLECAHVNQIVDLLRTVPIASNANYMICDGQNNILDVEATTNGPEVLHDAAGFLAHSNHFVCSRYAATDDFPAGWKDSFPRLERINSLMRDRRGSLTVDDIKRFLSDHEGYPASICRHGVADSSTVASLIAEPGERRLHVAFGNPCQHAHVTYSM